MNALLSTWLRAGVWTPLHGFTDNKKEHTTQVLGDTQIMTLAWTSAQRGIARPIPCQVLSVKKRSSEHVSQHARGWRSAWTIWCCPISPLAAKLCLRFISHNVWWKLVGRLPLPRGHSNKVINQKHTMCAYYLQKYTTTTTTIPITMPPTPNTTLRSKRQFFYSLVGNQWTLYPI